MALLGILSNKRRQYWVAQIGGWSLYYLLVYTLSYKEEPNHTRLLMALMSMLIGGILLTHLYRKIIIQMNWFARKPLGVFIRVVIACIAFGAVYALYRLIILDKVMMEHDIWQEVGDRIVLDIINGAFICFLWSALYFIYHYVNKARREEIKNLQWEASKTEIELKNLKSQLNPHFMFNSMNSIRALIDEDPKRAKFAVTQLSSILRNTLLMGKNKTVSLRDEINVVKDYLSLEGIRYEERLIVAYDIDKDLMNYEIPPLMIQTLVENAIKHGVSKLPSGGELKIRIQSDHDMMNVFVENSGSLDQNGRQAGIGLRNTKKRLELLYGDKFDFLIEDLGQNKVLTKVSLPKIAWNESNSSR